MRTIGLLTVSLVLGGCHFADYVTPKTGPGTEYPCGARGIECHDEASKLTSDQACCPPSTSCRIDNDGPYCHGEYEDPMSPNNFGTPYDRILRFAKQ